MGEKRVSGSMVMVETNLSSASIFYGSLYKTSLKVLIKSLEKKCLFCWTLFCMIECF